MERQVREVVLNYSMLKELDKVFYDSISEGAAAGMAVALITEEEKWFKCYGFRQLIDEKEAATLDTLWDLASCSKVLVTATCIMKLVEEGLISLDTKIAEVLPQLADKTVTVRQCLTHSTGFPADIVGYKAMSREEMTTAALAAQEEPEWIGKVHYSDINFILLGMLVAQLKGSLDGYAKAAMFEPLQMSNTMYCPPEALKGRCAAYEKIEARGGVVRGVVHDGKAFKFGGVSGHAGVFSTIEDVSHYADMMLHDGIYNGKPFFKPETIALYKSCLSEGMNEKRSIGWVISDANYPLGDAFSDQTLFHTGFSGPSILIDLKKKLACIVLANRVHPTRENRLLLEKRNEFHTAAYKCLKGESYDTEN